MDGESDESIEKDDLTCARWCATESSI